MILYLVIGLFFVMLRMGSVLFEIGVKFFLLENLGYFFFIIFMVIFFIIICFFLLNFVKIVDLVGKVLIFIKLMFIGILVVVVVVNLIGKFEVLSEVYIIYLFFKGF